MSYLKINYKLDDITIDMPDCVTHKEVSELASNFVKLPPKNRYVTLDFEKTTTIDLTLSGFIIWLVSDNPHIQKVFLIACSKYVRDILALSNIDTQHEHENDFPCDSMPQDSIVGLHCGVSKACK